MATFFPGLARARRHAIEVVQEAGETIFVPSNWFHTVENLHDTLSINHNWLNGSNVRHCWRHVELMMMRNNSSSSSRRHEGDTTTAAITTRAEAERDLHAAVPTTTDNSQVDDDVLLLWHVVSKKANEILECKYCGAAVTTIRRKSDLEGILFVLDGLLALIEQGGAFVLATRSDCNVAELRAGVVGLLSSVEESVDDI